MIHDVNPPTQRLRKTARLSFGIGAVGAVVSLGLALADRTQFFQSYLQSAMLMLGIPGGCFALLMIQHLTGGQWAFWTRRPMEAAVKTLPVAALLMVPIFFGMHELYHWTHHDAVAGDALLQHKTPYLNTPFFILRTVLTLGGWIAIGLLLVRGSLRQDQTEDLTRTRSLRRLSGFGVLFYGLSVTWSSWDWTMSLEPHWFSSIWGPLFAVGQGLTSFAFLILVLVWIGRTPFHEQHLKPGTFHDLGNLMFAFVILWIYMSFSQFLIIWSGNLPEEILWYLDRAHPSWQAIALFLAAFHFVLPFFLLLTRVTKLKASWLAKIAGLILLIRIVDYYWTVAPTFHEHVSVHLLDLTTLFAVAGIWFGSFCLALSGMPLVPLKDPRFEDTFAVDSH